MNFKLKDYKKTFKDETIESTVAKDRASEVINNIMRMNGDITCGNIGGDFLSGNNSEIAINNNYKKRKEEQ